MSDLRFFSQTSWPHSFNILLPNSALARLTLFNQECKLKLASVMYRERKAMIMKLWKTALAALVNLAVLLAFSATSTQAAVKKVS